MRLYYRTPLGLDRELAALRKANAALKARVAELEKYLLETVRHHWDFDDCGSLDSARWEHLWKMAGGGRESAKEAK